MVSSTRDTLQGELFFSPHILRPPYNEDTHTVVLDTPPVYVSPNPCSVTDVLLHPFGTDWGREGEQSHR